MSSKIFGYSSNELKASHDFQLSRSQEGLWTCSQVFTCLYTDYNSSTIKAKISKGTPITDLNSNIPIEFAFITLRSHRIAHKKGGITQITCEFSGADPDDGFSGGSDRSTSISYRGVMAQAPVIEHPNFLRETTIAERAAIRGLWFEEAYIQTEISGDAWDAVGVDIRKKSDGSDYGVGTITREAAIWWISLIKIDGVKYYDRPLIEYTVTQTNKDGITQDELDDYGRVVNNPPYNPIVPSWFNDAKSEDPPKAWWQFSGITEDRDENSSVYSRTYTMRDDTMHDRLYDPDYVPDEPA